MTIESVEYLLSLTRVKVARDLMEKVFDGKLRKYNGAPYFTHLDRVARKTAIFPWADEDEVIAAYLHDWPEDFGKTVDEQDAILRGIAFKFGENVSGIVKGLTNVNVEFKGLPRAERKQKYHWKLIASPFVVRAIKLIDRIDNIREMMDDLRAGLATDHTFQALYADESKALLDALKGTDPELENELQSVINSYRKINLLSQRN